MIIKRTRQLIYRIKCELMYRKATEIADKKAYHNGCIYYVLPTESGKLMVINRQQYMEYRKLGLTPKDGQSKDLFHDCVYHTNCNSAKGKEHRKRKFLKWKGIVC